MCGAHKIQAQRRDFVFRTDAALVSADVFNIEPETSMTESI